MNNKKYLTHDLVAVAVGAMVKEIHRFERESGRLLRRFYAIPRGGIPIGYLLLSHGDGFQMVNTAEKAHFFVDDLIDSGNTMERYRRAFPGRPFFAPFNKRGTAPAPWYVFPWEIDEDHVDKGADDAIVRLLQFIGEDPGRGGLQETPQRALKAWGTWTEGYKQTPADVFKVFEDGAEGYDEMVVVKDIPFYSHCEHHMAPFFGTATVAYIPNGSVVGLSKINRLVNMFSRRLQVQERLTTQIVDAMVEGLSPVGAGVIIKARHLCMESRGVCQHGHHTVTSALRGALATKPEARAEFMALAR